WDELDRDGMEMPRTKAGVPFVPKKMPHPMDSKPLGFEYFRCVLEDADLSNFTLPRTYFCRSGIQQVNFTDTDLSSAWMCWNDFIDCDCGGADLSGCQMRASNFTRCRFIGTDLRRADMRRSAFEGSDFTHGRLTGAKADRLYGDDWDLMFELSKEQTN